MSILATLAQALASQSVEIIDLTQTLNEDTPLLPIPTEYKWGESWPFSMEEISRYDDKGPAWYWNNIKCGEHTGTHFDAPVHWVTGKDHDNNTTETLPLSNFIGPAFVIDAVEASERDNNFLISVAYIKKWEKQHGQITEGSWVLYRTDWSTRNNKDFLNGQADGCHHTPGWDPDTVRFLAEERNVVGLGVETVGTDSGMATAQDPMFPCHSLIHGANKCGLASLCNLDKLPPTGAIIIAAPLKIKDGSGSPLRVLALVESAITPVVG